MDMEEEERKAKGATEMDGSRGGEAEAAVTPRRLRA
jgi:hypothetical protein